MHITDFLIDPSRLEWESFLGYWNWLFPPGKKIKPWLMNCFGDLFWKDAEGQVHFLNISEGSNTLIADCEEAFFKLLQLEENAVRWLLTESVQELGLDNKTLSENQCFALIELPILDGEYSYSNVYISQIEDYWKYCGLVHRRLNIKD